MKHFYLTLLVLCYCASLLDAAPRKVRGLNFPNDEDKAPRTDITLQQDALTQKDSEATAAIRMESDSGPRLTERQEGETFAQYRERLEEARERLKNNTVSTEELKKSQQEALYEAEYQLRKEAFYDEQTPMYGQGSGNWGIRSEKPLELQRVLRLLESKRAAEAAAALEASSATVEEPTNDQQREEGRDKAE